MPTFPESSSNDTSRSTPNGGATDLAVHAKDVVAHVADKAKHAVDDQLVTQQKRSVGELGDVAKALRSTREQLGDNLAAPVVERAAEELEKATRFLESASLGDIVEKVEGFARREPLLFAGGAFVVGMLGARFLKSSARRPNEGPASPRVPTKFNPKPASTGPYASKDTFVAGSSSSSSYGDKKRNGGADDAGKLPLTPKSESRTP
ncbi:MAG: hypothetical protein ABI551_14760 [Polyangiaceae bacterium]